MGGVKNSWHLRGRAIDATGPIHVLEEALSSARIQRISANCTGPEEAFIEFRGTRRQHLHVAW